MWKTTAAILADALHDLRRSWREVAVADVAWKAFAFAVLTPGTLLLLRWLLARRSGGVIADAQIATVLLTTPYGLLAFVLGSTVLAGITALECACLMAIGLAAAEGRTLDARRAILFSVSRAHRVLALAGHMVLRLMAGLLPFAGGAGLVFVAFLRDHDINYYLSRRPPAFWAAVVLVALLVGAFAFLLVRTMARWVFALPIVLFEDVLPRNALGESRRRSHGDRLVILAALASWTAFAILVVAVASSIPEMAGRALAPHLGGSLAGIVAFVSGLALFAGFLALLAGVLNATSLSLVLLRLYLAAGEPRSPRAPGLAGPEQAVGAFRTRRRLFATGAAVAALVVVALVLLASSPARTSLPVAVIAHRGSSAEAPENSLAAFRLAVEQRTDYVELDVQESADGEVLVVHDSDLMKLGGGPAKIWEASAAELRTVDIGSRTGPQFASERVPTLAEALAVCKGRSKVVIELKQYGHDVSLEEKVVAIVEAAGMAGDCVTMSLDHEMVKKMKRLRPSWRSGVLVAKAIGDVTALGGDFVAVQSKMATHRFVRLAHRAGQEVYVWTVDDPAWMLSFLSRGVDGLITNRPDVAREVVARRASMSDAERVLTAILVRLGARPELLAGDEQRP